MNEKKEHDEIYLGGMTPKEVLDDLKKQIQANEIKIMVTEGFRYYTDVMTETLIVPITTPTETAEVYYKEVIAKRNATQVSNKQILFEDLPRVSMFVGQPDTGKTYLAQQIAKDCGIEPLFIMCRDNLNLETLLENFKLIDGKPVFEESLAIKMLSGDEPAIIILDEFNTLLTGVMKTLQPIFDDTSTSFEYRGKIYKKNMQCKFIVTLNDKDKGISIIPDAILSRSKLTYFDPVDVNVLSKWTGYNMAWIKQIQDIYKLLNMLNIFGTRQLHILHKAKNIDEIKKHLNGLCVMKQVDNQIIDSLQMTNLLSKL